MAIDESGSTAARDPDDRIIYDQASGNPWFDADGNGAGARILFADLANNSVPTAADFTVIRRGGGRGSGCHEG